VCRRRTQSLFSQRVDTVRAPGSGLPISCPAKRVAMMFASPPSTGAVWLMFLDSGGGVVFRGALEHQTDISEAFPYTRHFPRTPSNLVKGVTAYYPVVVMPSPRNGPTLCFRR
jgi:hypothetical protein